MQLKEDFDHWLDGREDEEQQGQGQEQGQDVKDISYRLQLSSTFSAALLLTASLLFCCTFLLHTVALLRESLRLNLKYTAFVLLEFAGAATNPFN